MLFRSVGRDWTHLDSAGKSVTITIVGPANWGDKATGVALTKDSSENTKYSFKLFNRDAVTISNIPVGTYTVTEGGYGVGGYTVVATKAGLDSNSKLILTDSASNGTVTFTNTYTQIIGGVDVKKTTDGYIPSTAVFTFKADFEWPEGMSVADIAAAKAAIQVTNAASQSGWSDNSFTFTITGVTASGKTVRITNIPKDTKVTVTETDAGAGNVGPSQSSQERTVNNGTVTLSFHNTRERSGEISVGKVAINAPTDEKFTFTIYVNDVTWKNEDYTISPAGGTATTSSTGTFQLGHGETATFSNLPLGAEVKVVETANSFYTTTNSVDGVDGDGTTATVSAVTTTLTPIVFTNSRDTAANLTVTKVIDPDGNAASDFATGTFTFVLRQGQTAAGAPYQHNGAEGTITGPDGKFSITLDGGTGSATFVGLPAGDYYVTEVDPTYEDAKFTFSKTGEGGVTLTKETAKSITITNTFVHKYATLSVSKTVEFAKDGVGTNKDDIPTSFEFILYQEDGTPVAGAVYSIAGGTSGNTGGTTAADGTFQLEHGETATFSKLYEGKYYVVETLSDPAVGNWTWSKSGDGISAVKEIKVGGDTQTISVKNTFTHATGSLTVNKTVLGGGSEASSNVFTFKLYAGSTIDDAIEKNYVATQTITGEGTDRKSTRLNSSH